MAQIVIVEGGAWETHALGRLVVVQKPLELRGKESFYPRRHPGDQTSGREVQDHTSARAARQQPVKGGETLTITSGDRSGEHPLPRQSRAGGLGAASGVKATYMAVEQRASLTG